MKYLVLSYFISFCLLLSLETQNQTTKKKQKKTLRSEKLEKLAQIRILGDSKVDFQLTTMWIMGIKVLPFDWLTPTLSRRTRMSFKSLIFK